MMSNVAVLPRPDSRLSIEMAESGSVPYAAAHSASASPEVLASSSAANVGLTRKDSARASHKVRSTYVETSSSPVDSSSREAMMEGEISTRQNRSASTTQPFNPTSSPLQSAGSEHRRRVTPMSPRQQSQMAEDASTFVSIDASDTDDVSGKDRSKHYGQLTADQTRTSACYPSTPPPHDFLRLDPHAAQQHVVNRTQSLRVPTRSGSGDDSLSRATTWRLPSHNRPSNERNSPTSKSSNRRLISPSASMSLLATSPSHLGSGGGGGVGNNSSMSTLPLDVGRSSWTRNARRWSSSLPRGRESAAFAFRLAEGASPYLRAGLEELRSIFDVDSNPIPSSPFVDEYDDDDEGHLYDATAAAAAARSRSKNLVNNSDSDDVSTGARQSGTLLCIDDANGTLTASPAALSSREPSPSRSSVALLRTPSDERHSRADDRFGSWTQSNPNSNSDDFFSTKSVVRPAFHHRGESLMPDDLRQRPYNNRQFLACSLCVIAVGMTALSAWGYAMQSDTFSITLIVFFLTQPAFALAALASLLLRKRTWMDLCSRALRAHVLAQALIVVLAYLDLSASALYVPARGLEHGGGGGGGDDVDAMDDRRAGNPLRGRRFSMVPSMEMRFGPLYGAREAADGPASSSFGRDRAAASAVWQDTTSDWSVHAHDSAVGDWRSRLTHLIVFIVQAAVPIVMILVGQYVVAQRLAWLARQGGLSRQGSLRQQQQESGSYASSSSKSPSNNDHHHHHHQTSYMAGSAARPTLARLDVPSPQSVRRDLPPLLRLPGGGASATDPTHFARREQQRRRRLATSSGIPERVPPAAATSTTRMTSGAATMAEVTSQSHNYLHRQQDIVTVPRVMTPSHRHNRSASQPVNLTELAAKATFPESVSGTHNSNDNNNGSGLGVTFDDDESHHP